jgi:sigma-B regulation protein RsbU (phosphoserine phosphatase)
MLGVDGVKSLIRKNAELAVPERLDAVLSHLNPENAALRDDLTFLAIEDKRDGKHKAARPSDDIPATVETGDDILFKLIFPSRADRLKLVRSTVQRTAELCGFAPYQALDVVIAVDEACQNIIRHAYGGKPDGKIELKILRGNEKMILLLRDFAETIDVAMVKPRELDDLRPGGLGTHFIREIMDEVEFLPPPPEGGNLLKMVKKIT